MKVKYNPFSDIKIAIKSNWTFKDKSKQLWRAKQNPFYNLF